VGEGAEREWVYDPRREERRQLARVPLPEDLDPRDLDGDTRKQLMSLSKDTADVVARHLIMAGRLMDEDPEQALKHARAARALAGRVGAVREANGLVAYTAGEWSEALSELRTARRLTGDPEHLPVMADCERALGRPDRALLVAEDPQAKGISPAARVELMIVASGARRDMGQAPAAVASLQVPALEGPVRAWTARLRYAYADALLDAGREDDARQWFARAAEVDEAGETDADERVLALDGMIFEDLESGDGPEQDDEATRHGPDVDTSTPVERADDDMSTLRPAVRVASEEQDAVVAPVAERPLEPAGAPEGSDRARDDDTGAPGAPGAPDVPAATAPAGSEPVGAGQAAEHGLGEVFLEPRDSTSPAPGRAGTTGLGFIEPAAGEAGPVKDEDDELRLFD
jgi:tetratricopeptide (TPR) repeat protein